MKKNKILRHFKCTKCKEEVTPFIRKRNGQLVLVCPECERKITRELENVKKENRN